MRAREHERFTRRQARLMRRHVLLGRENDVLTTAMAMGIDQKIALAPAASKMTSVACGAYATDDSASDEKTASAFFLVRRSLISSSLWIGAPTNNRQIRPHRLFGSSIMALASMCPAPRREKPTYLGRVTRTTASPG